MIFAKFQGHRTNFAHGRHPPTPIFGDGGIYWFILDERLSVPVISTCFWSDIAMKFRLVAHEKLLNRSTVQSDQSGYAGMPRQLLPVEDFPYIDSNTSMLRYHL